MNRDEKTAYNLANELDYYFATFTPKRAELRKEWSGTRKDWNHFRYDAERKHQAKNK